MEPLPLPDGRLVKPSTVAPGQLPQTSRPMMSSGPGITSVQTPAGLVRPQLVPGQPMALQGRMPVVPRTSGSPVVQGQTVGRVFAAGVIPRPGVNVLTQRPVTQAYPSQSGFAPRLQTATGAVPARPVGVPGATAARPYVAGPTLVRPGIQPVLGTEREMIRPSAVRAARPTVLPQPEFIQPVRMVALPRETQVRSGVAPPGAVMRPGIAAMPGRVPMRPPVAAAQVRRATLVPGQTQPPTPTVIAGQVRPAAVTVPAGQVRPAAVTVPAGQVRPATVTVPAGQVRPPTVTVPAGQVRPAAVTVPAGQVRPAAVTVPAGQVRPVAVTVPAGQVRPVAVTAPAGQVRPAAVTVPASQVRPAAVTVPAGQVRPAAVTVPAGQVRPAAVTVPAGQVRPAAVTVPAGQARPAAVTVPAGQVRPAAVTVPASQVRPAAIPATARPTASQTQPAIVLGQVRPAARVPVAAQVTPRPAMVTSQVMRPAIVPGITTHVQLAAMPSQTHQYPAPATVAQAQGAIVRGQVRPPVITRPAQRAIVPGQIAQRAAIHMPQVATVAVQPTDEIRAVTTAPTTASAATAAVADLDAVFMSELAVDDKTAPAAADMSKRPIDNDDDDGYKILLHVFDGKPPPIRERMEPGKKGREIELISNMFPIILPKGSVFHYDAAIYQQGTTQEESAPTTMKARCASTIINRKVIETLSEVHASELNGCKLAFDGRKNIYTRRDLPFKNKVFVVEAEADGAQRSFHVHINYAALISLEEVWAMYEGSGIAETFQESIQASDVIVRTGPTLNFVPVGRSFFSPPKREDGDCQLGGARTLWFGFYTSIRLGIWKPLVNVDMSATAFYSQGPLLQFIQETIDPSNRIPNLFNVPFTEHQRVVLVRELRTLKIRCSHVRVKRHQRIENISRKGANEEMFDWEGRQISVADYFAEKYNVRLRYPTIPCVIVGKRDTKVPIEVCEVVPGQHCRRKLSETQTSLMIKRTAVAPKDRFRRLMQAADQLCRTSAPYCSEFGMKIDPNPVRVSARLLPDPVIKYANNRTSTTRKGVWNLENNFLKAASINRWAVAVLGDVRPDNVQRALKLMRMEGGKLGMKIPDPVVVVHPQRKNIAPREILEDVKSKVNDVDITLVMLGHTTDYGLLKATAETSDLCMRTQCVRGLNVSNEKKFNGMFAQNLLQKINTKLGGVNNSVAQPRPAIFSKAFMVIGIDVYHAGAGDSITPSVAAVVASMDSFPSQYYAVTSVQQNRGGNRLEFVMQLDQMFLQCIQRFHARNKILPLHLIIYRDGLSEEQFDAVRLTELAKLRSACTAFDANYKPPMMFIVVQKRHHVRFMPSRDQDGVGKTLNIPPGSVVDSKIVHPRFADFYLCSHQGIQGTSRPTHYHVVHDDSDMPADDIYMMTYSLCHTYARCTRAVSLPAPAYYAHLVALRAKEHIKGVIYTGQSMGSDASGSSTDANLTLDKFSQAVKVTEKMRGMMYFV